MGLPPVITMSSIMGDRPSQQFSHRVDGQSTPNHHHRGGDTYNISGHASVHLGDYHHMIGQDTFKALLDQLVPRLSYPQMTARSHQITQAFPATFDWMLQEQDFDNPKIDCFISWLSDDSDANGIYWVNGKPGSGKSTMTKFLDSRFRLGKLVVSRDMPVVRAQYFFWSGGNSLERCLEGMCRSLIIQILQQQPGLLDMANHALADLELSPARVQWNSAPLSELLLEICLCAGETSKILLLIDGLDECMAQEEEQSRLVELVLQFSELHNVKVVVTSRPENIFYDAFQDFSQVRMESLTHADIIHYVNSRLRNQRRWKQLERENPDSTQSLLSQIITSANGVFLWVVLVVRDLLHALIDGDDLRQLHRKLDNIPLDLEAYFRRIVESIEPLHRAEASKMLQLTAFNEDSFPNTLDFRLMDVFFTNETADVFAYNGSPASKYFEIGNQHAFQTKVAGLLRRLRSRCKGLLECTTNLMFEDSTYDDKIYTDTVSAEAGYNSWLNLLFNTSITYLHRSFRDFLLLPDSQKLIHSFTDGRVFDCRGFFINARALQIANIWTFKNNQEQATCLASHVMTALSMYNEPTKLNPVIQFLEVPVSNLASISISDHGWFITSSFDTWEDEQSTFLSLAIDFGLIQYVSRNLTPEAIATKSGRPLLDYILRPRFQSEIGPAYDFPSMILLDQALKNGADPNQPFTTHGPTVWAAFLWSIRLRWWRWHAALAFTSRDERYSLLDIVNKLLDTGASPFVQKRWLNQLRNVRPVGNYHYSKTPAKTGIDSGVADLANIEWVSVTELLQNMVSGLAETELTARVRSIQGPWLEKNAMSSAQIVSAGLE